MRCRTVYVGPDWDDASWINGTMAFVIMPLGGIEVEGRSHTGDLVKIGRGLPQVGIIHQAADITFEMPEIYRVEAQQCREQPEVSFRDRSSQKVAAANQSVLQKVQHLKQQDNRFLVGVLCGGKA